MSKILYPIFNLPNENDEENEAIPTWVKWWLLNNYNKKHSWVLSEIIIGNPLLLANTVKTKFYLPPLPRGNSEQATAILPTGYTQLDFIESTGTQYINTGITADNTVEFDVTFNTSSIISYQNYGCIFGSRQASGINELQLTTYRSPDAEPYNQYNGTFRAGDGLGYNAFLTINSKITVKFLNAKYYINNEEKYTVDNTFSNNYNIFIFALNNGGNAGQHGKLKLYSFKLYKNGSLVRDYIPCENSSDEVGLYDLVSKTFFGNSGTGTFTAGDEVTLPNPDFEVPIQNVTGDVEVLVQNKNLAWNGWAEDFVSRINDNTKAKLEIKDDRSCLFFDASAGYGDYDNKYMFKPQNGFKENTQYTLAFSEYTTNSNGYTNIMITYKDGTNTEISGLTSNTWNDIVKTSTATKTIEYIQVRWRGGDSWIDLDTFMVLEGAYTNLDIPAYTPHQEQTFTFPLGNQRMFLGDYLSDDGIHHVRKQVEWNGTESWATQNNCFVISITDVKQETTSSNILLISNSYKGVKTNYRSAIASIDNSIGKVIGANTQIALTDNRFLAVADFETWLSENPITVEYVLAEEEITPYTSEQQTAYNEILQATSYKEQTNISGISSEAEPIFEVQYYMKNESEGE